MSYCRFYNTNHALNDCLTALNPDVNEYELSAEEELVGIEMFKNFLEFCLDKEIIQDYDVARIVSVFKEHRSEVKNMASQED